MSYSLEPAYLFYNELSKTILNAKSANISDDIKLYYINGGSSSIGGSGYYKGPFNWGAEVHYQEDKGSVIAYVECNDVKLTGGIEVRSY